MTDPRYWSQAWRRLSKLVLARDGYACQIKGPRCSQLATQVDHIEAVAAGGSFWDPSNLRAACRRCNGALGGVVGNERKARKRYVSRF